MQWHQILVVEDDAIAARFARVLDAQGYEVRRLSRGGTAVAHELDVVAGPDGGAWTRPC